MAGLCLTYGVDAGPLLGDLEDTGDDDGPAEVDGGQQLLQGEGLDALRFTSFHLHLINLILNVKVTSQLPQSYAKQGLKLTRNTGIENDKMATEFLQKMKLFFLSANAFF